jgi:hypothetical protein
MWFVFEVSAPKKISKELLKQLQDLKTILSVGENYDVDCYGLFEESQGIKFSNSFSYF